MAWANLKKEKKNIFCTLGGKWFFCLQRIELYTIIFLLCVCGGGGVEWKG